MRFLNRLMFAVMVLGVCLQQVSAGEPIPGLQVEKFSSGIAGWEFAPGSPQQVTTTLEEPEEKQILQLQPQGAILGVNSAPIKIDQNSTGTGAWKLTALLKNEGLQKGVFAFSLYCYDAADKPLKQLVFRSFNPQSTSVDWRRESITFGPGTPRPLPAGTEQVRIRFSFAEPTGDCQGKVLVKQVQLEPYQVPGNQLWPAEIVANVGDLQIRFESRSFWTLYRIDYQGTRLGLDRYGSHYGSVANFPGTGFIGTGHTENEDEQVLSLQLTVDGKEVKQPPTSLTCNRITLQKTSRIRSLILETEITVADSRIWETVTVRAEKPTPVNLIYHFMHPWLSTAEEYYAELQDGSHVGGLFDGDKAQEINQPTRWSALFDSASRKGAVTYVLSAPADPDHWQTRYWDIDHVYRKHYFVTFQNQTIPADQKFRYEILTLPFAAESGDWKEVAEKVANSVPVPSSQE